MDAEFAEETSILALQVSRKLTQHLSKAREECTEEDYTKLCKSFGKVLGCLYSDVMQPIYDRHPELKPVQLDGTYAIDPAIYSD